MRNRNQSVRTRQRGFTLIELIVSVGLFALIMSLATGAYLVMISVNRQAQGISTGINNLSFALETMMRIIRTGTSYTCSDSPGSGSCTSSGFTVTNSNTGSPKTYSYAIEGIAITQSVNGAGGVPLTDPSVTISSLVFYVTGATAGDTDQPHVTVVISGSASVGPGKPRQEFTVETGATMRGPDL